MASYQIIQIFHTLLMGDLLYFMQYIPSLLFQMLTGNPSMSPDCSGIIACCWYLLKG